MFYGLVIFALVKSVPIVVLPPHPGMEMIPNEVIFQLSPDFRETRR
jgi:hypothetical protein